VKGVEYYYHQIETILGAQNPELAAEFKQFVRGHKPNEVYLWLYEKQKSGQLTKDIEQYMFDFFWKIY
jgi:hypothetical protein